MQIKEFDILLDIKKSNKIGYIEVVQGDSFSNVFNITLTNGLNAFNLTGTNVEIVFSKSDGTTVQQTDIAILNEITGKIQCVLKTNTIACPGKVAAEVRVLEGETLLTSTRFEFYVRKALMNDDTIESTNEFPLLTQLLNETNEALTEMEEAEELRNTNEATRQSNESTRQSNETTRQSNEATRQSNEAIRQANEVARESYAKRLRAIDQFGIFGVKWDKTSNPDLTRTDYNTGVTVNLGVDGLLVLNDFDFTQIWGEFKEVTDTYGNVFVRIPKCYIKKTDTPTEKTWQVSKTKYKGFYLPYCFWDFGNNKELDYIDVGKHLGSLSEDGTKLESKPDRYPLINKTIVNFRDYAKANNINGLKGYQQLDIHVIDLLQTLFIIELGTLNSQSKVMGFTTGQSSASHVAVISETNTNRIIVPNSTASLYEVGQSISIGTSLGGNQIFYGRTITAIETYDADNKAIIFDGNPVNITAGNYLYNIGYKTGFSRNIVSSVGSIKSNTSGKHSFVWHNIESLYGDIFQFVDGVNINENQAWVCKNANDYASNLFTAPYEKLNYLNSNTNDYITTIGFDSNLPFAEFPTGVSGGSTTYYSDYYYQSTGQRIALFGGNWLSGSYAGLFCWNLTYASSTVGLSFGGRLLKKPL